MVGVLGPRVALQSGQLRWNSISWYTLTKLELTTSLFHSLVREIGTRHTFATLSTCPYNIFVTEIGEWGRGRRASEDEHHLDSYSIKGTRTFEKFRHSFSSNKFFIGIRLSSGKLILGIYGDRPTNLPATWLTYTLWTVLKPEETLSQR